MSGLTSTSSEQIMQALFELGKAAQTDAMKFATTSRRFVMWDEFPVEQMPAFFQFQSPARNSSKGERGLPIIKLQVKWLVYLRGSQGPEDPVSPNLNAWYDLLSSALRGPYPGAKQTLGGLCTNCYEDGDGLTDEGLLTTPSLIVIPITILAGI